jgi:hypothetical protein
MTHISLNTALAVVQGASAHTRGIDTRVCICTRGHTPLRMLDVSRSKAVDKLLDGYADRFVREAHVRKRPRDISLRGRVQKSHATSSCYQRYWRNACTGWHVAPMRVYALTRQSAPK